MDIKRIGSQPSNKGPADWFTGTVCIDPLFHGKMVEWMEKVSDEQYKA
jgi:hypothetical protein